MRTALIVLLIVTLAFSGALAIRKSHFKKFKKNSEKQSVVKTLLK